MCILLVMPVPCPPYLFQCSSPCVPFHSPKSFVYFMSACSTSFCCHASLSPCVLFYFESLAFPCSVCLGAFLSAVSPQVSLCASLPFCVFTSSVFHCSVSGCLFVSYHSSPAFRFFSCFCAGACSCSPGVHIIVPHAPFQIHVNVHAFSS